MTIDIAIGHTKITDTETTNAKTIDTKTRDTKTTVTTAINITTTDTRQDRNRHRKCLKHQRPQENNCNLLIS